MDYVRGEATVDADRKVVIVDDEDEYPYDKLLICTGSSPLLPDIKGVENAYTYKDTLKIKQITEIASFDDPFGCPRSKVPRQPSGWLPADQHFTQSMKSKVAQFFVCLFLCLFLSPLILSHI